MASEYLNKGDYLNFTASYGMAFFEAFTLGLGTELMQGAKAGTNAASKWVSGMFGKKAAAEGGSQGGLNLFKWGAEQTTKSTGWKAGDYMLHLPNKGTPALNWKANYGALRKEMGLGNPIYDSYRTTSGQLIQSRVWYPMKGKYVGEFLNAERFTLQSRGWIYNPSQGAWLPPIK